MELILLLLTAGLAAVARAQFVIGNDGKTSPSYLCNKTFADANATGIFSFNPGVNQGPQEDQPDNDSHYTLDAQWGVTVYDNIGASNATAEVQAWYNTGGAKYTDNANLWYDVCVITVNTLTADSQSRVPDDKGDCMATLDDKCVTALKEQATVFTVGLVGNPTPQPGSNLTAGSLGHVCYDIGNMMTDNFPKECTQFFNGSATVYGTAMTSSTSENSSFLYDGCTLTNEADNSTFRHAAGSVLFTTPYTEEEQKIIYANLTQIVLPVLTVFLPIADIEVTTKIQTVNSALSCPHINHVNAGSMQPYPPPEAVPIGSGSGLSGGAIAGIVIGVLAALALTGAALWFFYFRKRRAPKRGGKHSTLGDDSERAPPPPAYTADAKHAGIVEAPPDNEQMPLTELSGREDSQVRPELPTQKSGPRVELAGDATYKDVIRAGAGAGPGGAAPAELPASLKE